MDPNLFSDIVKKICCSVTGKQKRAEIEEELFGHLEDTYERNLAMGKTDEEAQKEAVAALGDLDVLQERLGAVHSFSHAAAVSRSLLNISLAFFLLKTDFFSSLSAIRVFLAGILLLSALTRLKTVNKKLNTAFFTQSALVLLNAVYACFAVSAQSAPISCAYLIVSSLLSAATWYFLFAGFLEMYKKFCCEDPKKPKLAARLTIPMILLPLGSLASCALLLANDGEAFHFEASLLGYIVIIFYIFVLIQLARLRNRLWDADAEYGVSPWRKMPAAALCAVIVFSIACPLSFMYITATREPATQKFELHDTERTVQAQEIRQKMKEWGMEEAFLNELPDSEILNYEQASSCIWEQGLSADEEYVYDVFDFYFYNPEQNAALSMRSLLRITENEEKKQTRHYRSGIYLQYFDIPTHTLVNPEPNPFVCILQRENGELTAAQPLFSHFDGLLDERLNGFEFKAKENQIIYFAITHTLTNPYEYASSDYLFWYIRQDIPFAVQHNTVTELAKAIESAAFFSDVPDWCFSAFRLPDPLNYEPSYIGMTEEDLSNGSE